MRQDRHYYRASVFSAPALVRRLPGLSRELQNLPFLAACDAGDMIGPNGQGVFHFALIWTAIVSAGDASLVTTDVVQYRLDDMRLHADVGHSSRRSPAQIVHRPSARLGAPIKRLLAR